MEKTQCDIVKCKINYLCKKNFYNVYGKQQTVSAKSENAIVPNDNLQLSWSHYLFLMRIDNLDERKFYEIEAEIGFNSCTKR